MHSVAQWVEMLVGATEFLTAETKADMRVAATDIRMVGSMVDQMVGLKVLERAVLMVELTVEDWVVETVH